MKMARWTAAKTATMGPKLYAKCVKLAQQIETQINVCAVRALDKPKIAHTPCCHERSLMHAIQKCRSWHQGIARANPVNFLHHLAAANWFSPHNRNNQKKLFIGTPRPKEWKCPTGGMQC